MEKIKIYDIHGKSAMDNFQTLITPDKKYFYWDDKSFRGNTKGDIVFWVNRTARTALFTRVDEINLRSKFNNGKAYVNDKGYSVYATAPDESRFSIFYRFRIDDMVSLPESWDYTDPSTFKNQLMAYGLYEQGIKKPEGRIEKMNDLANLFSNNQQVATLIDDAVNLLTSPLVKGKIKSNNSKQGIAINEMEKRLLMAIKTKPFILLAGASGTGKSRLVRTLAFKTCLDQGLRGNKLKPGNFEIIPVRPNWHDSTELLGFLTRIGTVKYISTLFLKFIAKAWKYQHVPFFLCMDEMNLAHVEQYFAEYLSILETRKVNNGRIVMDVILPKDCFEDQKIYNELLFELGLEGDSNFEYGISIPPNLVVIGTVNMDETTKQFSSKVLDRAMAFELNTVDLNEGLENIKDVWEYPEEYIAYNEIIGSHTTGASVYNKLGEREREHVIAYLEEINKILVNSSFLVSYRVRDEFLIYCYYTSLQENKPDDWLEFALDEMTYMKILPKIYGNEDEIGAILQRFYNHLNGEKHLHSVNKLSEMKKRFDLYGHTSFWK